MKSRFLRCLPLALLILSATLSGCATSGTSATSQKHIHTPWRYKHMNHMHTRPWSKDQKPLVKTCAVCENARR